MTLPLAVALLQSFIAASTASVPLGEQNWILALSLSPSGSKEMTDWVRSWNAEDVDAYIAASLSGDWGSVRGAETLTREQFREEDIMLGLRTDRGVPSSLIMTSGASAQKVESLLASGALVRTGGDQTGRTDSEKEPYLRIPEDRFFVSDDIIAELI